MDAASKRMEETMKLLSLGELRRCSRAELLALYDWISNALALYPEGSAEYEIAVTNLRNIRWVLAHPCPAAACHL
jgi:hypothetical protein